MELTLYFLRLAPWIVRPASPSARAGTMMAAIRTKFEVALKRSRFPESADRSQQLADMPAPPPPNEAAGRSCPRPWPRRRPSAVSCSGSFFYPKMTRRGRRLAARSGRRGGGLLWPADGPPRELRRHRGLRAPQRWAGGGLRLCVAADPVDGRAGVLPRPPAARPERHWRRPAHRAASLALGATPTNTGGCAEYKCPRCMARFTATQCYREIAERTWKVPLPGPEKSLLPLSSAELAPLTCYADLEVYSTPAPTVHIAQWHHPYYTDDSPYTAGVSYTAGASHHGPRHVLTRFGTFWHVLARWRILIQFSSGGMS